MMNQGQCFLCNKIFLLTELKNHMINHCYNSNDELNNDINNDFSKSTYLLLIERDKIIKDDDFTVDKFTKFWICVIIKGKSTFEELNLLIKNKWNCCKHNNLNHCYNYKINKRVITNSKTHKTDKKLNITRLYDELNLNSIIECEFDDILTTKLKISVIDIFKFSNEFLFDNKILAQNCSPFYQCKNCKQKNVCNNMIFCTGCNKILCLNCVTHDCLNKRDQYIVSLENNPRSGIVCFDLNLYKIGKEANQLYEALESYKN